MLLVLGDATEEIRKRLSQIPASFDDNAPAAANDDNDMNQG